MRFIFWKVILIKIRIQYRKEHIFLNKEKSINLEVIYMKYNFSLQKPSFGIWFSSQKQFKDCKNHS